MKKSVKNVQYKETQLIFLWLFIWEKSLKQKKQTASDLRIAKSNI